MFGGLKPFYVYILAVSNKSKTKYLVIYYFVGCIYFLFYQLSLFINFATRPSIYSTFFLLNIENKRLILAIRVLLNQLIRASNG